MKGIFEPSTFCKCSRRLPTSGKFIIAAALAAMMLISLTACGKVPPTGNSDQDPSAAGNAGGTVEMIQPMRIPQREKIPQRTRTVPLMTHGKLRLKKVCWKTTASSRIIMRNWKTAYIRSM